MYLYLYRLLQIILFYNQQRRYISNLFYYYCFVLFFNVARMWLPTYFRRVVHTQDQKDYYRVVRSTSKLCKRYSTVPVLAIPLVELAARPGGSKVVSVTCTLARVLVYMR
jgi:hypothetical protein